MRFVYVMLSVLLVTACGGKSVSNEQDTQKAVARTFEMVSVPTIISEPEKRAEYLSLHYWDKFDFTDTAYIHLPEVTEQAFTNYLAYLAYASPAVASTSIKGMLQKAEADSTMYAYFTKMYEKYLYDPNSPTRNEELYINVLESILASPLTDDVHKIRPAHLLELAMKNRVGDKATDFTYTLATGQSGKMHQIKAGYLLLFFYNPDCEACRELVGQLVNSPQIQRMRQSFGMKILAFYPDEDLAIWKENLSHIPGEWIVSYDATATLKNDEVYDLKAIPCLYLLDKDKKVILKDASFDQLMQYLSMASN